MTFIYIYIRLSGKQMNLKPYTPVDRMVAIKLHSTNHEQIVLSEKTSVVSGIPRKMNCVYNITVHISCNYY